MKLLINNEFKKIYPNTILQDLNITHGIIKKKDFNSKKEIISSHTNKKFILKKADFKDLFFNIKRGPQIITYKDACFIAFQLGLMKGFNVLDCGGGSGALTCVFANMVGSKGKVVSVEKNKKFYEIINENAKLFGFKNIKIINSDLNELKIKTRFDAINFDLPNPWDFAKKANELLKNGSRLTVYVPNTTQLSKSKTVFEQNNFMLEHVFELILREWNVNELICRPKFNNLGHTGFIMCFRKLKGVK